MPALIQSDDLDSFESLASNSKKPGHLMVSGL